MADEFGASQSFGESTELGRGEMTLEELDGPFDIRQPRRRLGGGGRERQFQRLNHDLQDVRYPYKSLADVVLGNNQDVKFHRTLTDRTLATKYAKDHRLSLGEDKDYNEDGINDVILFNKFGDPVVINGYALANTEYPYRKAFYEANPKKSDRMRVGGYNKWVREFIPDHAEGIAEWGKKGIKVRSVKEGGSSRNGINQLIKEVVSTQLTNLMDPNLAKFIISLFPWFQIYSYIYDELIVRYIIDVKAPDIASKAESLEDFKRLLKGKNVKHHVDSFLKSDDCKALIVNKLDKNGVMALGNMIAGGSMDKFIQAIRSVSNSPADYITNPELHVQKQLWKEQLAANVDAMRERTREYLNGVIAAK